MRKWILAVLLFIIGCSNPQNSSVVSATGEAVIYSEDSRNEVTSQDTAYGLAQATVQIINKSTTHNFTLGESYPLCKDERFQNQKIIGYCSGVLVAPNKILTAGHCMDDKNSCELAQFVFGRTLENSNPTAYSCKRILNIDLKLDYAIVELDRDVTEATPVSISSRMDFPADESVLSLSYPLGVPLKQDLGRIVSGKYLGSENYFRAYVDTFSGSSGSPLFDQHGFLIGILSRGEDDFLEDEIYRVQTRGGCVNFNRCKDGEQCRGETFLKAALISDKI